MQLRREAIVRRRLENASMTGAVSDRAIVTVTRLAAEEDWMNSAACSGWRLARRKSRTPRAEESLTTLR